MSQPYSVADYLAAPLGVIRVRDLERLCTRFDGIPLAAMVADLRGVLGAGIRMGDDPRLHILITHLYHEHGASLTLTEDLRAEVADALPGAMSVPARERGGDDDVLLEPGLPEDGMQHRAEAAAG